MLPYSKYIVGIPKSSLTAELEAVVIPLTMQHSDVRGAFVDGSITSAGFFNYDQASVYVSGISTTLNRASKLTDARLVAQAISHPSYAN